MLASGIEVGQPGIDGIHNKQEICSLFIVRCTETVIYLCIITVKGSVDLYVTFHVT